MADRGFGHAQLISYLWELEWDFRLRLKGNTRVSLKGRGSSPVKALCPPVGEKRFFCEASLFRAAIGPVHLALAVLADQPDDPWYVASSQPTDAKTLDEYGLRFDSEEAFLDEKSGGYQIHTSELATPEVLERLILILAVATLHFTSIGVGVVHTGKRRWVDTHWDRGLSYLKIGWRWQRQ